MGINANRKFACTEEIISGTCFWKRSLCTLVVCEAIQISNEGDSAEEKEDMSAHDTSGKKRKTQREFRARVEGVQVEWKNKMNLFVNTNQQTESFDEERIDPKKKFFFGQCYFSCTKGMKQFLSFMQFLIP